MTVQKNIEEYKKLYEHLNNHPMAARLLEDDSHITMIFPEPVRGLNAVRVSKGNGKIRAMKVLLDRAEKFWRLSNEVLYPGEHL